MIDKHLVALHRLPRMTNIRLRGLLARLGSPEAAWRELGGAVLTELGMKIDAIDHMLKGREGISPEQEVERLQQLSISVITERDELYPQRLKEIHSPPYLLYLRGEIISQDDLALAVVGTRKMSQYGARVTDDIVGGLARQGLTIISGLALGVDSRAHQAALKAGGRTLAVLGCGLDQVYPSSNRGLAQKIIDGHGAVISEFPLDIEPLRQNFPARNRIISGLSRGTLVVEGGVKSGSLITAGLALEQGREVFAVPGDIYRTVSLGPNHLIARGEAQIVSSAEEILETLDIDQAKKSVKFREIVPESDEERILLDVLTSEPCHIDDIARQVDLDFSVVSSTLMMMELRGMCKNLGSMNYVRVV